MKINSKVNEVYKRKVKVFGAKIALHQNGFPGSEKRA